MMSTRTPKKGRLLLAAACGLAMVTQGESGRGATEPSPEDQSNVSATAEVAPAPSVESATDVPVAEAPIRTETRRMRRNAGRSSLGRYRRSSSYRQPTGPITPVPDRIGDASTDDRIISPSADVDDSVTTVADESQPETAAVPEAMSSGDTVPRKLPQAAPAKAPRRGFVLFGRKSNNEADGESTGERRSLLSRIFNRGKKKTTSEPEIQVASPEESPAADESTGPETVEPSDETIVATEDASDRKPWAPTDLPEPSEAPESPDLFELPAPVDERPTDAVVESNDEPASDSIATSEPAESIAEELENPFPELSESEADDTVEEPVAANDAVTEENPFEFAPEAKPEATADLDEPRADENPFAVPAPAPMEKVAETPAATPEPEVEVEVEAEQPTIQPRRIATAPNKKPIPEVDVDPRIKRIRARDGLTGLKGFCPVALRDDRQLVDSDEAYTVVHKSRTYTLSSKEALRKFEADPQKYAPVASGHDVILLTVEGRRVEGTLDHAVWYKDRLHLFSNRDTLSRFVKSLNRDPFAGNTRPASNEVPAKESNPKAEPAQASGPQIRLPAPLPKDEKEEVNPFEFEN